VREAGITTLPPAGPKVTPEALITMFCVFSGAFQTSARKNRTLTVR